MLYKTDSIVVPLASSGGDSTILTVSSWDLSGALLMKMWGADGASQTKVVPPRALNPVTRTPLVVTRLSVVTCDPTIRHSTAASLLSVALRSVARSNDVSKFTERHAEMPEGQTVPNARSARLRPAEVPSPECKCVSILR